jgi:hypothetical protein
MTAVFTVAGISGDPPASLSVGARLPARVRGT